MKINIGTKNKAKLEAVENTLKDYSFFSGFEIFSKEVDSGVADQPKNLEETIRGAKNRAEKSFSQCDFSFGIESGLMEIEKTHFDVCVVSVFDGKIHRLGFSSAWQCPQEITKLMLGNGLNMTEAACQSGLSKKDDLGSREGLIGILTKGRIKRREYTIQALQMALIQIENPAWY